MSHLLFQCTFYLHSMTFINWLYTLNISSVFREDGHVGRNELEDNKYNCDLQSLCTLLVIFLLTVDFCMVKHAVLRD
jgi:hypothetical protein